MDIRTNSIGIMAFIALAGTASGQIQVEYNSGSGFNPASVGTEVAFPSGTSSGSDVTLLATNGIYRIFTGIPGSQDIGVITYDGGSSITVLISNSASNVNDSLEIANGARNWAGLVGTGAGHVILQASITGSTTGPITAGNIERLDIDGDIGVDSADTITVDPSGTPELLHSIESTTGDINADIIVEAGDIGVVHAPLGAILGDIRAEDGTIERVFSANGIGDSSTTVEIFAGADVSSLSGSDRVTIAFVGSKEDIYADITASDGAANEGRFGRLIANTGAALDAGITGSGIVGKAFTGTFVTYDADGRESRSGATGNFPTINLNTLDGTLLYYDVPFTLLAINTVTASSTLIFDKGLNPPLPSSIDEQIIEFTGPLATTFPAQVIINASGSLDTNGDPLYDWDAEVQFSNNTFSDKGDDVLIEASEAPYYEELPSDFGGGSIGLAPFNFHTQASDPVQDGTLVLDTQFLEENTVVVIEHYGPVFEGTAPEEAVKIEYCTDVTASWVDVTHAFDITVAQSEAAATRFVSIKPSTTPTQQDWDTGVYRISPDDLLCALVTGTPSVVYDSTSMYANAMDDHYVFMVATQKTCMGNPDTNLDGIVSPADFNAWIIAFNNSTPQCDQNGDGLCTPADFNAWIINYNNGCP